MKKPMIYNADFISKFKGSAEINNKWVLARPIGMCSIWRRFYLAWLVFTGKCDVLRWSEGQ